MMLSKLTGLKHDPDQMHNHLGASSSLQADYTLLGRSFSQAVGRLDALLMVLKSCKARTCHEPWEVLHPGGNVKTLKDALHKTFDAFYEEQPKVSFSSCEQGYLIDVEGPQKVNRWSDEVESADQGKQQTFQYSGELSWWT